MDRLRDNIFRRPAKVPVQRFDAKQRRWLRDRGGGAAAVVDRLTVATYNIWFDAKQAERRYRAIADVVARESPDIVAFQEVTQRSSSVFLAQRWIRDGYRSAAVVGGSRGNYGMLLLSRLPLERVSYTRLPTQLSRGYLTAHLVLNGRRLSVISVHLESGKASAACRARQLGQIFESECQSDNVIMMGDFNMRDAEDGIIVPDYQDAWPVLRPDEPGYTEDTDINHMRFDMKNKHRQVRFDRVLVKGDDWKPESIELLGREPISGALPRVFPSDHFGVRCTLQRI